MCSATSSWNRKPKLWCPFASTAGEWATREPPSSEPLHRRFPLRDQVRWALAPSDFQHSRYSTATFPKLSTNQEHFHQDKKQPSWFPHDWELNHGTTDWTHSLQSFQCFQWHALPTVTCPDSILVPASHLSIYQAVPERGSEQHRTGTNRNSPRLIINGWEVLILWGATSCRALSSMRFNLCLILRLMNVCLWNIKKKKNSLIKNRFITQDLGFRKTKIKLAGLKTSLTITASVPLRSEHPSLLLYEQWKIKGRWLTGQNITPVFRLCYAQFSVLLAWRSWMNRSIS